MQNFKKIVTTKQDCNYDESRRCSVLSGYIALVSAIMGSTPTRMIYERCAFLRIGSYLVVHNTINIPWNG